MAKKKKQIRKKLPENQDSGGVGRPTVMTPEVILKLEEAFAWGCSDIEACFYAGISKSPFYEYQEAHPEFKDRKEELKSKPILQIRRTVLRGIIGGPAQYDAKGKLIVHPVPPDPDLGLKYLERVKPDEFRLRSQVTDGDDKPIFANEKMPDAQAKKVAEFAIKAIEMRQKLAGKIPTKTETK